MGISSGGLVGDPFLQLARQRNKPIDSIPLAFTYQSVGAGGGEDKAIGPSSDHRWMAMTSYVRKKIFERSFKPG